MWEYLCLFYHQCIYVICMSQDEISKGSVIKYYALRNFTLRNDVQILVKKVSILIINGDHLGGYTCEQSSPSHDSKQEIIS